MEQLHPLGDSQQTASRCRELPAAPEPPREATRQAAGRDPAHLKEKINQNATCLAGCRATPGSGRQSPGHAPEEEAAPSRITPGE